MYRDCCFFTLERASYEIDIPRLSSTKCGGSTIAETTLWLPMNVRWLFNVAID